MWRRTWRAVDESSAMRIFLTGIVSHREGPPQAGSRKSKRKPRTQRARLRRGFSNRPRNSRSVRDEAVEQSRAAGGFQLVLAAAARAVRGIPGLHVARVLQPLQVLVADDRRAFAALGPVAAGGIAARGREAAVRIRAGQDVVLVRRTAPALAPLAFLGQGGLLVDIVVLGVQLAHALRHHHALGVAPRAFPDARARVYALVASRQCRAQVGAPVRVLGARGFGERVAMRIGAFEAAEIGAVALADAGYEERHVCLLGVHRRHAGSRQDRRDENTCRRNSRKAHLTSVWNGSWLN